LSPSWAVPGKARHRGGQAGGEICSPYTFPGVVRDARVDDAEAIARVHVGWCTEDTRSEIILGMEVAEIRYRKRLLSLEGG
jgi:hypothetical protein